MFKIHQGVKFVNIMFTSGKLGIDASGLFAPTVEEQANRSLLNVKAILEAAGFGMEDIVKTTVFLKDMNDFQAVNEVYASFFSEPYPARSAVEVARLPKDGRVEIEVVARKS
ncbi:Rid family detoxifying hydrolase [Paenibacillus sp. NPDC058910]|uniref:Rid family detoxifying hydrolase n=1 Tax=Paenibacillus sp. NPDC058910 TaxID=3346670 RepID=UPI003680BDC9